MALPDNYDPWLHLQETLLTTFNLAVEQSFVGVPVDSIETALGSLRQACLLQMEDSAAMTQIRMMLFYFTLQGNLPTPIYGIPVQELQSNAKFHPQVKFYFLEDYSITEAAEKLPRATGQMTFRLMNFTSATINKSEALILAEKIKVAFGEGSGFTYEKGPNKYTYKDPVNGYDFRLLTISKAEAIRVIETVLEIQGHTFDETAIISHTSDKVYPAVPPTVEVYGTTVPAPRTRPTCMLRFRYAQLLVHGKINAVTLVDLTGKGMPLVR